MRHVSAPTWGRSRWAGLALNALIRVSSACFLVDALRHCKASD